MDNPERHLREFIRNHYYSDVPDGIVDKDVDGDVDGLIAFMRECGWQFEMIPADAR